MSRLSLVIFVLLSFPLIGAMDKLPTKHKVINLDNRFDLVNQYIEELDTKVDKDLIRAIAWKESNWRQYKKDGNTVVGVNKDGSTDIGLMQINMQHISIFWNKNKLKNNTRYNLKCGVILLEDNIKNASRIRSKKNISDKYSDIDIALKCYNGWQKSWKYIKSIKKIYKERPWEKYLSQETLT